MRKLLPVIVGLAVVGAIAWLFAPGGNRTGVRPEREREAGSASVPLEWEAPGNEVARLDAVGASVPPPRATGSGVLELRTLGPDGEALPNTQVSVLSMDEVSGFRSDRSSGAGGTLRLEVPAGAPLRISSPARVALDGRTGLVLAPIDLAALAPNEVRTVELRFVRGCESEWRARFLRAEDRVPIASAELHLLVPVNTPFGDRTFALNDDLVRASFGRTDTNGRITFCASALPRSELLLTAPGREPVVVRTEARRAAEEAEFLLHPGAGIVVRVLDRRRSPGGEYRCSAKGAVRALTHAPSVTPERALESASWSITLDATRAARFQPLPPFVPLFLALWRDDQLVHSKEEPLILDPGETREVELVIGAGARLGVRVVGTDQSPIPGRRVGLTRREPEASAWSERVLLPSNATIDVELASTTDAGGFAEFERLAPGAWWIVLLPTRAPWDPVDLDAVAPCAHRVEIPEWKEVMEVVLHAERGLYIRGRVVTPDGRLYPEGAKADSTPNVVIFAHARDGGGTTGQPGLDGEFAIGPLPSGTYDLETHSPRYAPIEPLRVVPGDKFIELRMRLGGRIEGRVVDGTTGVRSEIVASPVASKAHVVLRSSDEDGDFAFDGLAEGEYVVSALATDGRHGSSAKVRVGSGESAGGVRVELEPLRECVAVQVVLEGRVAPGWIELWQDGVCTSAVFVGQAGVFTLACRAGAAEVRWRTGPRVQTRRGMTGIAGETATVRIGL